MSTRLTTFPVHEVESTIGILGWLSNKTLHSHTDQSQYSATIMESMEINSQRGDLFSMLFSLHLISLQQSLTCLNPQDSLIGPKESFASNIS